MRCPVERLVAEDITPFVPAWSLEDNTLLAALFLPPSIAILRPRSDKGLTRKEVYPREWEGDVSFQVARHVDGVTASMANASDRLVALQISASAKT